MGYHYSTFLEIQFFDKEAGSKFFNNLKIEDEIIDFETNSFFIDTTNGNLEADSETVYIIGESHSRSIGGDNVKEFFNEIECMGKNIGIEIKNIYLRFYSYDDREEGYTIFVRNLEKDAVKNFITNSMISQYGEDYKEETDEDVKEEIVEYENDLNECSKAPWMICCGEYELQEVIETDEEERDDPFDFESEVAMWSKNIINNWEFPWDEGCTMWAAALDEDGEYLWDNQ